MDDTTTTVVTEPMIFPNGEVHVEWTRTVNYTASDVPVQAIVEMVRKAAEVSHAQVIEPDGNVHDLTEPDEYVYALLDAQVSSVREIVLDALRADGADVNEDEATVESVEAA